MRRLLVRSFIMAAVAGGFAVFADAPAAAQVSTLDTHRTRAVALFDRRLEAASATRTELTDDWKKYQRACRGKVTTGHGIGVVFLRSELVWFAQTLRDRQRNDAGVPHAHDRDEDALAAHLPASCDQIDEDARRRGIYPGVMRDLKRQYGFE